MLGLLDFLRNTLQFKIVNDQALAAAIFKKSLREIPVFLFVFINASSLGFVGWLNLMFNIYSNYFLLTFLRTLSFYVKGMRLENLKFY